MNEATPASKPAARKAPAKAKEAEAQTPAVQPEQQTQAKQPFVKKAIGGYNFELKEVPIELKEAAQARFGRPGVAMAMTSSKANGSYKGEILNSDQYLAQRVSENSVVFHKKADIEFASNDLQYRDQNKTLNRADIALHYDGSKAKAYPHDAERENLSKMVNSMKKIAEKLNVPDIEQFKKSLDDVHGAMWDQVKERRKVDQTKERPQPQRERGPEQSR
jgi:putative DNA primase/helicase